MKKLAIIILVGLMTLSCSEDSMEIPEPTGEFINRAGGYSFTASHSSGPLYIDFRDGTKVVARQSSLSDDGLIQYECIDATYTIIEQSHNHIVMDITWTWVYLGSSNDSHYEVSIELDRAFSTPPRGYMIIKNMRVFNDKIERLTQGNLITQCD